MSIKKRLRVILAALFQTWHEKRCGECGTTYLAVGPHHPELVSSCDACQMRNMAVFMDHAEAHYQRLKKTITKGAEL